MYWNYKSNFSMWFQSTKHNIKRHSNSSFIHHSVSGTKWTDISKNTNQTFVFTTACQIRTVYMCVPLMQVYTRLKYTMVKWAKNEGKVRCVARTYPPPKAPRSVEDRITQTKGRTACPPGSDALATMFECRPFVPCGIFGNTSHNRFASRIFIRAWVG